MRASRRSRYYECQLAQLKRLQMRPEIMIELMIKIQSVALKKNWLMSILLRTISCAFEQIYGACIKWTSDSLLFKLPNFLEPVVSITYN